MTYKLLQTIVLILGLAYVIALFSYIEQKRNLIYSDSEGYYMYLPAWFIHDGFEHIHVRTKVYKRNPETNKYYTKYSMGVALAQAPMFLLTDLIVRKIPGKEYAGTEMVYSRSIVLSGWLFCVLGLFFIVKWLRKSTEPHIILVGLIAMLFGTNLWYYATAGAGMSHTYSFGLFSIVLYLIDKVYRSGSCSWLNGVLLGVIISWIILIRPTNAILLPFIFLYSHDGNLNLKQRINFWISDWMKLIPFVLASAILWYSQLQQWADMRGGSSAYSYTNEGFIYWSKPKMLRVLIDVQNGLLLYSPVILISLYGLVRYFNEKLVMSRLILGLFFVMTWVFGSWWAWWFGGAYGHRCYVEFYAILIIPFIWVVEQVHRSKNIVSIILFYVILLLMLYYSLGLTYAYRSPWDGPNWNWHEFSTIVREGLFRFFN